MQTTREFRINQAPCDQTNERYRDRARRQTNEPAFIHAIIAERCVCGGLSQHFVSLTNLLAPDVARAPRSRKGMEGDIAKGSQPCTKTRLHDQIEASLFKSCPGFGIVDATQCDGGSEGALRDQSPKRR